jgi:nitroreductase
MNDLQLYRRFKLWTFIVFIPLLHVVGWNGFTTTITSTEWLPRSSISTRFVSIQSENEQDDRTTKDCYPSKMSLDDAILNRYACKKFRRYCEETSCSVVSDNESINQEITAAQCDPTVLQRAIHCLDLARRTPSSFNTQPYKVVLVYSPEQKMALSRYCLDVNAARVRDSDCTAVFLADKEILRTFPQYQQLVNNISEKKSHGPMTRTALSTLKFLIALSSSGYPMPRFLAAPISFLIRTGVSLAHFFMNWFCPIPTLSNAETWASRQAMMIAMTYMLACTSRGLVTIPMEGM